MIHNLRKNFLKKELLYALFGIVCIGFGRASGCWWLAPVTASVGYAFCWMALRNWSFLRSLLLFFAAYLLQTSWMLSHPYWYIVAVWPILALLFALPYALHSALVVRHNSSELLPLVSLAAIPTLMEWAWTALPFGFTLHSAALCLSWNIQALQVASVIGGLGLTFLVFLTNLFCFALWNQPSKARFAFFCGAFLFPYLVGGGIYCCRSEGGNVHTIAICHMEEPPDVFSAYLPPVDLVEREWNKLFSLLMPLKPGSCDLVVLPEGVIPFAATAPLFRPEFLPKTLGHFVDSLSSLEISTLLSQRLRAPMIIGLEGRSDEHGKSLSFNSCYFITPHHAIRYDKQLLLPFGEYIPCACFRPLLAAYGIHQGFSPGAGPTAFTTASLKIVPFICYEETAPSFTLLAHRLQPQLLVSLSNDNWFPADRLRKEHCEVARIRAVELGVSLVRSCNQGATAAIDGIGRIHTRIVRTSGNQLLIVQVPCQVYFTLFARTGQLLVVAFLTSMLLATVASRRIKKYALGVADKI